MNSEKNCTYVPPKVVTYGSWEKLTQKPFKSDHKVGRKDGPDRESSTGGNSYAYNC